jgi:hypothetical protein
MHSPMENRTHEHYREIAPVALAEIAPFLRDLTSSLTATVAFEIMSGGLLWSDEFPEDRAFFRVKNWAIIRFVLNYRTSLILGEPAAGGREIWDEAKRQFPDWPGFVPERCSPELRDTYELLSLDFRREMDEMERELDEAEHGGRPVRAEPASSVDARRRPWWRRFLRSPARSSPPIDQRGASGEL